MLTRIHGKIQFECDDCSDVLDTEESDFSDALRAMKADREIRCMEAIASDYQTQIRKEA